MFTSTIGRSKRLTCLVVIVSMMAGCAGPGKKAKNSVGASVADLKSDRELSALRVEVIEFIDDLESAIRSSADRIERNTTEASVRRAAMLWKVEVFELTNDVNHERDPRINLLNCCVFTVRLRDYFSTGEGKDIFGDQQPIAVQTADRLQEQVESLAREYFPEERLSELHRDVKQKARKSPIQGLFQIDNRDFYSSESAVTESALSWLVTSPWRAFQSGQEALDPTSSLA